ncbi:MAG: putative porin [Bacteroidota bacterium]
MKLLKIKFFLLAFCFPLMVFGQIPGRPGRFPTGTGTRPGSSTNTSQNQSGNQQTDPNSTTDAQKKGKLLNDSTKLIYGPKTLKYFLEEDIFNNRKVYYDIDTLITKVHIFNFLQTNQNQYQDLGNMGTAARSVFFRPAPQIGAQLGYNAFDIYGKLSNQIKYYDTKSPYTDMQYTTGGNGDQMLKFDFSRNINSRWNAGIQLQTFVASKQYGSVGGRGQNSIKNWNVVLHNSYFSKDSNYTILANFNYLSHSSVDDGGVSITDNGGGGIASEDPFLTTANTLQKKKQVHIYQQYALANGFQLYHILDVVRQNNSFIDNNYATGYLAGIYKTITALGVIDSSGVDSLFRKYRLIENKVGIKGFVKGFNYRVHFRRRDYKLTDSLDGKYVPSSLMKKNENFVGGWLNYYFKDSTKAFAEAEYLIGKDINFKVEYLRKHLKLGYYNVLSSPNLMQERFYSNLGAWDNQFENTFSNTFYGNLNYKIDNFTLSPSLNYSLIKNLIYFDTLANPSQSNGLITILQAGGGIAFAKKKLTIINELYFNAKTGPNLIRMPTIFINSRWTYDFKYAKKLDLKFGFEMHYKSAYYADAYMPVTQQFYLQDRLKVKPGLLADVFLNMKLNRVRLMVKYAQLNNLILGDYFVGPNFKGLRGGVSFGVFWPLFD